MITSASEREDIIARNIAAVDVHFHNENADSIDLAIGVYTDDIVWEVPARGLVHRDRETVKQEYLRIFGSMNVHKITNLHRFATEEWVFDDSIFEFTVTGDGFRNRPVRAGHRGSASGWCTPSSAATGRSAGRTATRSGAAPMTSSESRTTSPRTRPPRSSDDRMKAESSRKADTEPTEPDAEIVDLHRINGSPGGLRRGPRDGIGPAVGPQRHHGPRFVVLHHRPE